MTEQIPSRRSAGLVLPSGEELAGVGLRLAGTVGDPRRRTEAIAGLRMGIELGLTVVDTATRRCPAGDAAAHRGRPGDPGPAAGGTARRGPPDAGDEFLDAGVEELVAEAIHGRRDDVFLIGRLALDQLPPEDTIRDGILGACVASLRQLDTDRIDLYLAHRRGAVPLTEIVGAVNLLMTEGHIRHWGVAGFDVRDLVELTAVPGGTAVEANQVHYDLVHRDVEWDLLPRCRAARLPVLVHVPAAPDGPEAGPDGPDNRHDGATGHESAATGPDSGRTHPVLAEVARRHGASPGQVRLAWVLRQDGVYAIAEASSPRQVRRHHEALALTLTEADLAELDRAFPPPSGPRSPGGSPGRPPSQA